MPAPGIGASLPPYDPADDGALPCVDVIVPCFNEGPARAGGVPEVSRKPRFPAVLLRRRSEFPHTVVPNAAFGLAQARQLPICHKRANAERRQFVEHRIRRRRGGHTRARVQPVPTARCNV